MERRLFAGKLPQKIQERLKVLLSAEEDFEGTLKKYEQMEIDIRMKYNKAFESLYSIRRQIISGEREPSEEEVMGGIPEEDIENVKKSFETTETEEKESTPAGLENFWASVLSSHAVIQPLITEEDEPILSHLVDVTSCVLPGHLGDLKVTFTFRPNEYFKETELSLSLVGGEEEARIERSPITFSKPNFLYKEVVAQRPKPKRGVKRGKSAPKKLIPRQSFFWIFEEFDEDEADLDDEDMEGNRIGDEEVKNLLLTLHQKLIPSAIEYFTGERDGESDVDQYDGFTDEDEEDEGDEEVDEDFA